MHTLNPKLDLMLERVAEIPPEWVWKAWTRPDLLKPWFCPRPWTTVECEIDLRPGGIFRTVMRSPEGQLIPNQGCYLEIVEKRKIVWTNALFPGFRPVEPPNSGVDFLFTAIVTMEPHPRGTQYTAMAIHKDEQDRKKHEALGFKEGWGIALDQLVSHMKAIEARP
ncbi:MAG: SRPBCC family protein [Deltaproteobacteria bacterium]|nr:SRPBCC family protein [Deltaproteobacteria bacterium]